MLSLELNLVPRRPRFNVLYLKHKKGTASIPVHDQCKREDAECTEVSSLTKSRRTLILLDFC